MGVDVCSAVLCSVLFCSALVSLDVELTPFPRDQRTSKYFGANKTCHNKQGKLAVSGCRGQNGSHTVQVEVGLRLTY